MHELSIAESITEVVVKSCEEAGVTTVTAITLEIGRLSGIEVEALKFALDITLKSGPAENAKVHFEMISGIGTCEACGKESPMDDLFSLCKHCGSYMIHLTQGQELKIKKIEVIDEK